jgi:hypothetical protein
VNQHINYLFYSTKKKDKRSGSASGLASFFSFFIKGANNVSSDDKKMAHCLLA